LKGALYTANNPYHEMRSRGDSKTNQTWHRSHLLLDMHSGLAPLTKIIFFTIHDAPETAAVLRLLADDFIPKSAAGTELIPAVKRLYQAQG
jgi:hypothetical protein